METEYGVKKRQLSSGYLNISFPSFPSFGGVLLRGYTLNWNFNIVYVPSIKPFKTNTYEMVYYYITVFLPVSSLPGLHAL